MNAFYIKKVFSLYREGGVKILCLINSNTLGADRGAIVDTIHAFA